MNKKLNKFNPFEINIIEWKIKWDPIKEYYQLLHLWINWMLVMSNYLPINKYL
jgi:hypothetical protein